MHASRAPARRPCSTAARPAARRAAAPAAGTPRRGERARAASTRRDLLLAASAAAATTLARPALAEGEAVATVPAPAPPQPDPPTTHTAFLDLALAGRPAGRLLVDLFGDATPRTVANFLALAGSPIEDVGRKSKLVGKYKGSIFHRLVQTPRPFVLQGGDFERGNGTGGRSIYGGSFPDEAFLPHGPPGALSMANRGPNTGGSQFFITLGPTPWLDGKHVVFGRVRPESMERLQKLLAGAEVDFFSKPRLAISIADCGLIGEEKAGGVEAAAVVGA